MPAGILLCCRGGPIMFLLGPSGLQRKIYVPAGILLTAGGHLQTTLPYRWAVLPADVAEGAWSLLLRVHASFSRIFNSYRSEGRGADLPPVVCREKKALAKSYIIEKELLSGSELYVYIRQVPNKWSRNGSLERNGFLRNLTFELTGD